MNISLKYILLIVFLAAMWIIQAQTLTISGTVSATGVAQADALIDIYEYNSAIQTQHTDFKGAFSFDIMKGKEYLIVVYKSGYLLQSFSVSDNAQSKMKTYSLAVELVADPASPSGLYFKEPVKRISPDIDLKSFREAKFDLTQIRPQHRSDSVLVLLNRAQANQYILVSKMKISSARVDEKYSKQVEENIRAEMSSYATQIVQSNTRYDAIKQEEDKHVALTQTTKDDEQYNHLVLAQKALAERLAERSNYFLLLQQKQLSKARLLELDAIKYDQMMNAATDSIRQAELKADYWKLKAQVANASYQAMDANRKFLTYNKYQMLNYQEYIEMLKYKDQKLETVSKPKPSVSKPVAKPSATISAPDTSDNLSNLDNTKREQLIQAALEEEERFKNYQSKTEVKRVEGVKMTVQDIRIADDNYEMQTDKKGSAKYFKNGKPVTQLTFEFETKRKTVDVLNTIRQVDKFGR